MNLLEIQPEIKISEPKKLVGLSKTMSFAENTTPELWKNFMPRRKEIKNLIGSDFYSVQIYGQDFFKNFDPIKEFVKWAAIEVSDCETVPEGMETFTLAGGLYAVFHYKGSNTDTCIFQYILGTWLPASEYRLDIRPHFEVLERNTKTMILIPRKTFGFQF